MRTRHTFPARDARNARNARPAGAPNDPLRAAVERLEPRQLLAADPVISEFMASNGNTLADVDGEYSDWIEVRNPNATALDLTGYYLTDDAANKTKWRFPATTVAGNGYLVVFASDKDRAVAGSQLHTNFKLTADGEYLGLVKPDGVTVTSEYAPSFPAQQQDISYGIPDGSTTVNLINTGAAAKFTVPTTSLPTGYTAVSFNDSAWTSVTTGVGFGSNYTSQLGTNGNVQTAMLNKNATGLVRVPFTASNVSALTTLKLRMNYDDGYAAYLNGTLVASKNAPTTLGATSAATASHDGTNFEDVDISSRLGLLVNGTNVLAIQAMNRVSSNTDFLMAPRLLATAPATGTIPPAYLATATPGAANTVNAINNGPAIDNAAFSPAVPTDTDNITVTARVTPNGQAVSNVVLHYRVAYGTEATLNMADDGAHGDGASGDGVYGAAIPASASTPGQMVRWYITTADAGGRTTRAPFHASTESDEYLGAVIQNPGVTSTLPIIQLFASDTANLTTRTGTRASVFYNGEFYDNVFVRDRGGSSSDGIKVDFNHDNQFHWSPDTKRVDEINLNYHSAYDNANIRAILSFNAFLDSGHTALHAEPWRIQLNGAFWKQTTFIENVDAEFLDRIGLDGDGALYKSASDHPTMTSASAYEKKTRDYESNADLQAFLNGIHLADATARKNYILDNFDVMGWLNYWAMNQIVNDEDDAQKNFYLYRDTNGDGRWSYIVWDKDLTFGKNFGITDYQSKDPQTHPFYGDKNHPKNDGPNAYSYLTDQLLAIPEIKQMYLRRLRSVMDQFLQPTGTPTANLYFENKVDALYNQLSGDPQVVSYLGGATAFQTAVNDIKTKYLPVRRQHLYVDHSTNTAYPDFAGIPSGQSGSPGITIGAIDYNPAGGDQGQEYIQLVNPNAAAVDISGWKLANAVDFTFESGTVVPAGGSLYVAANLVDFKARTTGPRGGQGLYVVGGYSGQLSARGETIVLQDAAGGTVNSLTYAGSPTAAQQGLRVSEIMYHPANAPNNTPADDDFEYVELQNISNQTLNLNGVRFTNGINLTLGNVSLAPGAYGVVVRNTAAFQSRYGTGPAILGQYTPDVLDNGGERIRLEDPTGEVVLDFSYAQTWYPTTDGGGYSLVIRDPTAAVGTWGDAAAWRASSLVGGSPGAVDPAPTPPAVASVVVNDGTAQRSKVNSITVTFDQAGVTLGAGAFVLARRDGGAAPDVTVTASPTSGVAAFVLTFSGSGVVGSSLADGIYDLTVVASQVHAAGGGPAMAADFGSKFHRLYSDADGDGDSDNFDLLQLRPTLLKPSTDPAYKWYFDYDASGTVDNLDVFQVRSRRSVVFQGY